MAISDVESALSAQYNKKKKGIEAEGTSLKQEYGRTADRRSDIAGVKGNLATAASREAEKAADEITAKRLAGLEEAKLGGDVQLEQAKNQEELQKQMANQQLLSSIFGGLGSLAGTLYGYKTLQGNNLVDLNTIPEPIGE